MADMTNYTETKREPTYLVIDEEVTRDRFDRIESHLNTLAIGQAFIALILLLIAVSRWLG